MADSKDLKETKEPRDSGPLELDQLSDHELATIIQIERRLFEAQKHNGDEEEEEQREYLAQVQDRQPRVLLLDGDRGTGKTSILLTLVDRWHCWHRRKIHEQTAYKERFAKLKVEASAQGPPNEVGRTAPQSRGGFAQVHDGDIPADVRVIGRILDFDPLPPSMPLIAWIVQAWQPLAQKFDELTGRPADCEDERETLMDLWHSLFQVSAAGWSEVPRGKNLVEQVLDRQEQIGDWHRLDQQWKSFVWHVIKRGKCLKQEVHRLGDNPIFVIMIDDVDLQVKRVRELLHALRLLYHPNVFFLVAADLRHMEHVLRSDFYGQQAELAHHLNARDRPLRELVHNDPWAVVLSHASVEKVFPKRNRWKVMRLSLADFLAFPPQPDGSGAQMHEDELEESAVDDKVSFIRYLSRIRTKSNFKAGSEQEKEEFEKRADKLVYHFAEAAKSVGNQGLPGVMTYRAAEQLHQELLLLAEVDQRATLILKRLLSGSYGENEAISQKDRSIDVTITGQVAALHRPGPTITGSTHSLVLSTRPDFVFVGHGDTVPVRMSADLEHRFNFTGALLAKGLEEADFPVDAFGLRWDTYLSHAWTEWLYSEPLSFAWTRHKHPRPDEVFTQAEEWGKHFATKIVEPGKQKIGLWAYAWIYYQRKWSGHDVARLERPGDIKEGLDPTDDMWAALLDVKDGNGVDVGDGKKWQEITLALLARPELGFPPPVQGRLLSFLVDNSEGEVDKQVRLSLKRERRRLVTDARFAASIQKDEVLQEFPTNAEVEAWINNIDQDYEDNQPDESNMQGKNNRWKELIEDPDDVDEGANER